MLCKCLLFSKEWRGGGGGGGCNIGAMRVLVSMPTMGETIILSGAVAKSMLT